MKLSIFHRVTVCVAISAVFFTMTSPVAFAAGICCKNLSSQEYKWFPNFTKLDDCDTAPDGYSVPASPQTNCAEANTSGSGGSTGTGGTGNSGGQNPGPGGGASPVAPSIPYGGTGGSTYSGPSGGNGVGIEPGSVGDAVLGTNSQSNIFFNQRPKTSGNPGIIVANVIMIAMGFLGILAVALVTYAGFLWMTASGEEEKVKTATKILTQSVIGLIIVMAAWSIAYFVVGSLAKAVVQ